MTGFHDSVCIAKVIGPYDVLFRISSFLSNRKTLLLNVFFRIDTVGNGGLFSGDPTCAVWSFSFIWGIFLSNVFNKSMMVLWECVSESERERLQLWDNGSSQAWRQGKMGSKWVPKTKWRQYLQRCYSVKWWFTYSRVLERWNSPSRKTRYIHSNKENTIQRNKQTDKFLTPP